MTSEVKPVALKDGMAVILRTLIDGPVKFGKLRVAYFGEGRAKTNTATTAFYMKLEEAKNKGFVNKIGKDEGYELTALGRASIEAIPAETRNALKSEAHKKFEASPEGIAWLAAQPKVVVKTETEEQVLA
jgi:hypothetical protein